MYFFTEVIIAIRKNIRAVKIERQDYKTFRKAFFSHNFKLQLTISHFRLPALSPPGKASEISTMSTSAAPSGIPTPSYQDRRTASH